MNPRTVALGAALMALAGWARSGETAENADKGAARPGDGPLTALARAVSKGRLDIPADSFGRQAIGPRDMRLSTPLVENGAARAEIVIPETPEHRRLADRLNAALEQACGAKLPVVSDQRHRLADKLERTLVMLGNRDDNQAVSNLYLRNYVILDGHYPGPKGGRVVRTLHDPFGDGHNVVFAGGSDFAGTEAAVERLIELVARHAQKGAARLPDPVADIQLGEGRGFPENAKDAMPWEGTRGYGKQGNFGWNSLSLNLALFYQTNERRYADEFLRLAFPDREIAAELFARDDESYNDTMNPLADPYHYRSIGMILYWDLVEQSPVFSDDDRRRVTEKFHEQLVRRLSADRYYNPHITMAQPHTRMAGRHIAWEALTLYTVGRYFAKHYPGDDSAKALAFAANAFASLDAYAALNAGTLYWYNTYVQPAFTYLALSKGLGAKAHPVGRRYATALASLCDLRPFDWAMRFSSTRLLRMLASLYGDQAFIDLLATTGRDPGGKTPVGQSYWQPGAYPDNSLERAAGTWYRHASDPRGMPEWKPPFPVEEVTEWLSYRQTADAAGDFLLIDAKYETGGRTPFHNFNILTLRIAGATLLRGYHNQPSFFANGLAADKGGDYSRVTEYGKVGDTVFVRADLENDNGFDWRRTALLRENRWFIAHDEIVARDRAATAEIYNSFLPEAAVKETDHGDFLLTPSKTVAGLAAGAPKPVYALSCSMTARPEIETVEGGKAARFVIERPAGTMPERLRMTSLIAPAAAPAGADDTPRAAEAPDGRVALLLPEPAWLEPSGDGFVLNASDKPVGFMVEALPGVFVSDRPVVAEADAARGRLAVYAPKGAVVKVEGGATLDVPAGETREIEWKPADTEAGAPRPEAVFAVLAAKPAYAPPPLTAPVWRAAWDKTLPGGGGQALALEVDGAARFAVSLPDRALLLDRDGETLKEFPVDAEIGAMHHYPPLGLLVLGCKDEQVITYDLDGAKRWSFTSEMAEELKSTSHFYWFKKAVPGVNVIVDAELAAGRPLLLAGSTGTVEALDPATGALVARRWTEFGRVTGLVAAPAMDGKPARVFAHRRMGGWPRTHAAGADLEFFDFGMTRSLDGTDMGGFGYGSVGRDNLRVAALERGGPGRIVADFSGVHNRVGVWDLDGGILKEANFGPGPRANNGVYGREVLRNVNIHGIEVVDLDGDGDAEIAVAHGRARLFIFSGDLTPRRVVPLPANPTLLRQARVAGEAWLVVGCRDGSVVAVDGGGSVRKVGRVGEAVARMAVADGRVVAGTEKGRLAGFDL